MICESIFFLLSWQGLNYEAHEQLFINVECCTRLVRVISTCCINPADSHAVDRSVDFSIFWIH
jgi:hypothetical protein